MTTPLLTKQQQRHSLSAKKGPVKGLRNILAHPNPNFWPVVNIDQYPELLTNLNKILPLIQRSKNKIPKDTLKNMSKKDRKLAKKEMLEMAPPKPDILKFMIMGSNAVTRALEKDSVCCVLLDVNVEPLLMIKHIVTMAANKKIPVLLIPILKTITLQKFNFATIAFALKQEVKQSPDNVCYPLYKSITDVFKNFVPVYLQESFKSNEVSNNIDDYETKTVDTDCDTSISKSENPVKVFTDVYKYRLSLDKRIFIPPTNNESSEDSKESSQIPSDDFIPLDSNSNDEGSAIMVKNARYVDINKKEKTRERFEVLKKDQSLKSKLIDNIDSIKQIKRHRDDEPSYLPLKIKRVKGNDKRRKATKLRKSKEFKKK